MNRSMEVFIDLQTNHVHAVDASENLVAVASDEGIVRFVTHNLTASTKMREEDTVGNAPRT